MLSILEKEKWTDKATVPKDNTFPVHPLRKIT